MHKPEWLSVPAEHLLDAWKDPWDAPSAYDVVIVGSGYGGAVAAARLAACRDEHGKDLTVCVIERGREHLPGTFPSSFSELPGEVRFSRSDDPEARGVRDGLFDLRIGEDVTVLVANGLGGGSLINAGVVVEPGDDVFDENWPRIFREEWSGPASIKHYLGEAKKHLGVSQAPHVLKHERFVALTEGYAPDKVGVTVDDSCVKCGDCATGCNVGAKMTLSHTYLAQAKRLGAEIHTGATVSHIEPREGGWVLFVGLTSESRPLTKNPLREIRARHVILAAGALGSTEILMRSAERCRGFELSKCLGKRFSTNGDMISAFYGQDEEVNAAPEESVPLHRRKVGPTITGMARTGATRAGGIVIEELAIPGALRRVFEEVVTTAAMLERLGGRDRQDHRPVSEQDPARAAWDRLDAGKVDPAAVDPSAIECCQIVATMGDDGAKGRLEMVPGWNAKERSPHAKDGAIRVHWPKAGEEPVYQRQDEVLRQRMHLGGMYLRNPLWQPLPPGLSERLSGKKPSGLLFSVHPLGGCPMADDPEHGVVDHIGRVFDPGRKRVHPGLLVLDGSIIPSALGTNPLLTITALAERAIARYCQELRWRSGKQERALPPKPQPQPKAIAPAVTALNFSERMSGDLAFPKRQGSRTTELTLDFAEIPDIQQFLRDPLHPLALGGRLQLRPLADRQAPPAARVRGDVELLVRGATRPVDRSYEALRAYWHARGRGDLVDALRQKGWRGPRVERVLARLARWLKIAGIAVRALWRHGWRRTVLFALGFHRLTRGYRDLASNTGEIRYLFYRVELQSALRDEAGEVLLPAGTRLAGKKTLQYRRGENPWRQLMDLELSVADVRGAPLSLGTLSVDPAYLFDGFESRLRIARQRDLPAAWMDLASLALFLARVILKLHFWSFRLPEYQKYDPERDLRRVPRAIGKLLMERKMVGYPETPADAGVFLPITRYRKRELCPRGPVVLFHGLGSGGIQFATAAVRPNMAEHLANKGFDVWVAELRTSIAVPYSLDQWTIDEVARGDIPRIVDFVLKETGERQTKVVAHCIGSAMFCTAVLDGRLQHPSGESKIESAALLQVGPLITLSSGTRLRGLVTAPLRRFFPSGHVDFSVDDRASWVEAMIDRLLATYPYPPAEAEHHRPGWSWKHNSHIANCNRWAGIDGRMFEHPNLDEEMLDRLGEVLGHSSLTTWTQTIQYAFLERLTDSEGTNAYVTTENVRRYFRFPVLFMHGEKNDVFHPLTSWRSVELLKRVHGPNFPVDMRILDGYGHFDPLIGRRAGRDVFKPLARFLAQQHPAWAPAAAAKEANYFLRRPLIGPVVGWLRAEDERLWHVRLWCRLDDLRSPVSFAVLQVSKDGGTPKRMVVEQGQDGVLVEGPMGTLLCVDVPLDAGPGRYEIIVLSAHEDMAEGPARKQREAELDARKSRSAQAPHLTLRSGSPLEAQVQHSKEIDLFLQWTNRQRAVEEDYGGKMDRARIRVPGRDRVDAIALAVASCRYPGWAFDRQRADQVFGEVRGLLDHPDIAVSALFLIGDQIYADATAGAFDPQDRRERYYEAYREAWTAPNARQVLSRVPVYMMMDDHEAGDDWHPEDEIGDEDRKMRRQGLQAFAEYQWAHSPRNGNGYYYDFELRGFPVFVCDTRSGRSRHGILDDEQFDALLAWLRKVDKRRPKFIVSPSVVVPFRQETSGKKGHPSRSDGWDAYPRQLAGLFACIYREEIDNVVFLCGDAHLSMRCEIAFEDPRGAPQPFKAYSIVASPMYAPYPFANTTAEQYVEESLGFSEGGKPIGVMRYSMSACNAGDGFTVVGVGRGEDGRWIVESGMSQTGIVPSVPAEIEQPEADAAIAASAKKRA